MAASQFKLYNAALRLLGERRLASLSEERELRRELDGVWDDDFIRRCLEQGQWKFAIRTRSVSYNPSVEPDFGYRMAFDKPSDWIRTTSLTSDEYGDCPLTRYRDEAGYWFADIDPLYVGYVSDDSSYGGDMSLWPASFTTYAEHELGYAVSKSAGVSETARAQLRKDTDKKLADARSKDALNGAAAFPPMGTWAQSRLSGGRPERAGPRLIG